MLVIYVDADVCPVKNEVYRVARRLELHVRVVANQLLETPPSPRIECVIVPGSFDAADDWIAENASTGDIVISADIPLAARCLANGAAVLGPRGRPFSEESIGDALATRDLLSQLRDVGEARGGPPPFDKKDRSRFLHQLDELIRKALRG
jgi:uncharacterized protein YaiI (UPF0178 family)